MNTTKIVNRTLSQAINNARELLVKHENAARLGVVFLCPFVQEKYSSNLDHYLNELLDATSQIKCDAVAWSFPRVVRELTVYEDGRPVIYPGAVDLCPIALVL